MRFSPEFKDEGEVIVRFGDAQLIRFLDGKMELRGGSNDDRTAAREMGVDFLERSVGGRAVNLVRCNRLSLERLSTLVLACVSINCMAVP